MMPVYQEPTILRIPSISKQASFPDSSFFPHTPNKALGSQNPQILNNYSPSYVPPDSPYEILRKSGSLSKERTFEEKLLNENQILANVLKIRTKEIEDFEDINMNYKIKFKNIEEKIEELLMQNQKINEALEKSLENNMDLKGKIEEILKENNKLLKITNELTDKSPVKKLEKDRENNENFDENLQNSQLNLTIREQFKELDVWKEKYKEKSQESLKIEEKYAILLEKYQENGSFSNKFKIIEEKILSLELENQRLKKNEGFFDREKSEFQRYLQNAYAENDKIVQILDEKVKENQIFSELEEKIEVLISENNKLTESIDKIIEKHRLEKKNLEEEIAILTEKTEENLIKGRTFENKLKIMLFENEKLTEIIDRKNGEIGAFEEIEEKIELLVKENEKLNKGVIEKRNEVEYWKKRYFDQI